MKALKAVWPLKTFSANSFDLHQFLGISDSKIFIPKYLARAHYVPEARSRPEKLKKIDA